MDFDVWDNDNSILFLVFLPATHPPGPMKKKKEFVVVQSLSCPTLCDPVDCSKPDSCPSLSSGVCSDSYSLSWWCYPNISSSIAHISFWLQSFSASGSILMSQLFTSRGQSIGASASASVLSMKSQGWFLLGLAGLISLVFKGLSRVFSSTTVQKH